jgi:hypothetical protein
MVADSTISNSGNYGLVANGPCINRVTRSRITENLNGLLPATGTISSYGDNNLDGNTTDGTFTNTISTKIALARQAGELRITVTELR